MRHPGFALCVVALGIGAAAVGCGRHGAQTDMSEKAKQEIAAAEKDFAALCARDGLAAAFGSYAAEDARILTGDSMLKGPGEIRRHYSEPRFATATLQWSPDFIDAAASGDLGYTYGRFVFTCPDGTGTRKEHTGTFHTVWRKIDGKWKFVWDN
jgi:ketosteroid isomerase-like protein